jgi:hypothetical protein
MAVDSDVSKAVKTVSDIDHKAGKDGGATSAYHELKTEYDTYAKTHNADDTKKYWDGVTSQLKDSKVLPDLAVAWGKENITDGESTRELTTPFKYDFTGASPQYNFDKQFATQLADNVKSLSDLQSWNGPHIWSWGRDRDHVYTQELDKYLENQTKTNDGNKAKADTRNDQAQLFKGNPPLISVLDGANDGGKNDGHVSRGDMQKYVDTYNQNKKYGYPDTGAFTADNAKYVQEILDGKHDGISGFPIQGYTVGFARQGFTVSDLATAGGFKSNDVSKPGDYKAITDSFNSLQPATDKAPVARPTADQPVVTKDGDKVTSVKHDANGADITTTDGKVTDITYAKDPRHPDAPRDKIHFDYDANGKIRDFSRGPCHDVTVDADGTIHYKQGDSSYKTGTDMKRVPDNGSKTAPDQAKAKAAKTQIEQDAKEQAGEGPYQAAARLLGDGSSEADRQSLSVLLKQQWQDLHGDPSHKNDAMKGLEVGYQWISDDNFDDILSKSPALQAKYNTAAGITTQPAK